MSSARVRKESSSDRAEQDSRHRPWRAPSDRGPRWIVCVPGPVGEGASELAKDTKALMKLAITFSGPTAMKLPQNCSLFSFAPKCKGELDFRQVEPALVCSSCRLRYAVRDGIHNYADRRSCVILGIDMFGIAFRFSSPDLGVIIFSGRIRGGTSSIAFEPDVYFPRTLPMPIGGGSRPQRRSHSNHQTETSVPRGRAVRLVGSVRICAGDGCAADRHRQRSREIDIGRRQFELSRPILPEK